MKVKCILRPSALALAALSPCAAPTFTEPPERTQKFESETTSTTTAQRPHKQMCRQGSAGVLGPRDRQLSSPHFVHSPYSVHTYDARTDSRQRNDVHYSEMFKGDQGGNASQGQTEGSTERCAEGTTGHQVSFSPESSWIVHEYDDAYSPLVYGGRIRACILEKFPTHIIHSTGDCHHRISAAEADEPERPIGIQREHEPMQVCSDRTPEFHTKHAWRTVSRNPWVPQSQLGRGVKCTIRIPEDSPGDQQYAVVVRKSTALKRTQRPSELPCGGAVKGQWAHYNYWGALPDQQDDDHPPPPSETQNPGSVQKSQESARTPPPPLALDRQCSAHPTPPPCHQREGTSGLEKTPCPQRDDTLMPIALPVSPLTRAKASTTKYQQSIETGCRAVRTVLAERHEFESCHRCTGESCVQDTLAHFQPAQMGTVCIYSP